jgi:hypothetical protein
MTVFVQQLGRGLRLHPGKRRLIVLDFIGNYRRSHYKLPFLTGIEKDSPDAIATALQMLSNTAGQKSLPGGIEIRLEQVALELLRSAVEAPNSLRESLKSEFLKVQAALGRRPSLIDIERQGRYSSGQYRRTFSSWFGALEACGAMHERYRDLDRRCGAFLKEVEKTAMTRSYKMVVLDAMIDAGRFREVISLDELTAHFRRHFSKARFSREIAGTDIADIKQVAQPVLDAYVIGNPINAWVGGNTGSASPWFAYNSGTRIFSYIGPTADDPVLFAEALKERVDWRLETYLSRPGRGQTIYKVIRNGSTACIMLGNPSGDGLPRNSGWKVIQINGRFRYAKFARIAINWIAEVPDGKNIMTQELQTLLGADLLSFNPPKRVMMAAAADSDCWIISAVGPSDEAQ